MTEEEEQQEQEHENKRIRPRERALGQKRVLSKPSTHELTANFLKSKISKLLRKLPM